MKKKPLARPIHPDHAEPFVMSVADKLSDDPALVLLLGPRFKVIVDYDPERRRVTYSFRHPDEHDPDDDQAKPV